jgi:5-methyltetrahydrofolate--homocysteine methyltransferase
MGRLKRQRRQAMGDVMLKELEEFIVQMDADAAEGLVKKLLDAGESASEILNKALLPALDRVGVLFRDGDYFLPEVLMCVKAYDSSFKLILPKLKEGDYVSRGRVILGTVEGDIHEIGKNILFALLEGNGFDVLDLGVNVKAADFLAKAKEWSPDIIGMSSLLSTTMPAMKDVIDTFAKVGLRKNYKFIIGGAPVSQRFADEIGADGYGEDAQSGVELVKRLLAS